MTLQTPWLHMWLGESTNAGALPASLTHGLAQLPADARYPQALSDLVLIRVARNIIAAQRGYDLIYGNPYHNVSHALVVADRARMVSCVRGFSLVVQQASFIAALGHDLAHPGSTLRRDASKSLTLPELGVDVTNEYISGLLLDTLLEEAHIDVQFRAMVFVLIQATTFSPLAELKTVLESVVACADIAPSESFLSWIEDGANVLRETPIDKRPPTLDVWFENRRGFIQFVASRMDAIGLQYYNQRIQIIRDLLANPTSSAMQWITVLIEPLLER